MPLPCNYVVQLPGPEPGTVITRTLKNSFGPSYPLQRDSLHFINGTSFMAIEAPVPESEVGMEDKTADLILGWLSSTSPGYKMPSNNMVQKLNVINPADRVPVRYMVQVRANLKEKGLISSYVENGQHGWKLENPHLNMTGSNMSKGEIYGNDNVLAHAHA